MTALHDTVRDANQIRSRTVSGERKVVFWGFQTVLGIKSQGTHSKHPPQTPFALPPTK